MSERKVGKMRLGKSELPKNQIPRLWGRKANDHWTLVAHFCQGPIFYLAPVCSGFKRETPAGGGWTRSLPLRDSLKPGQGDGAASNCSLVETVTSPRAGLNLGSEADEEVPGATSRPIKTISSRVHGDGGGGQFQEDRIPTAVG